VIASAGAGKTTAIVNRIVTIAELDLNRLPNLVVVTYTNSAARAFKRRARDFLLTKLPRHPRDLLSALEQTFFGTIHGFCVRLLREYQAEAGLPDTLTKITDRARDLLWESFVADEKVDIRLRSMPIAQNLLRFCTLPELLDLTKLVEPVELDIEPTPPALDLSPVRDCTVRSDILPKQQRAINTLEQYRRRFTSATGYLGLPNPDTGSGKLKQAVALALDPLIHWIERAALHVAGALASDFKKLCVRQGQLSFNDQINLCRDLMKVQRVADDVRSRDLSVILDEAQDTQGAMFLTLLETVRPVNATFGSWPGSGTPPRPGTFSLVGDPRQTIYDERSGLAIYSAINSAFAGGEGGELLDMSVTWRCASGVVAAVNRMFDGTSDPQTKVRYDDLLSAPDAISGMAGYFPIDSALPNLNAPLQPDDSDSTGCDENGEQIDEELARKEKGVRARFRNECRQIAAWLAKAGSTGLGIHSWNQIAILGQAHQWLAICGEELQARGLPVSFYKQKIPFKNQPGFAWPVALLYTCLKPWDHFERVGVLRDIFCVSDVELAFWTRTGSTTDPELSGALKILEKQERCISSEQSLSVIVNDLLRETQLIERLGIINQDLPPLDDFLRRIYEAESSGKSVSNLLAELLETLDEEAELPNVSGDQIELITCHSSKGLEWDVVIPIGVDREPKAGRSETYPRIIEINGEQQIVWNSGSARQTWVAQREQAKTEQMRRLFYVTLTRAKKALIIPFATGFYERNKGSFASLLPKQPDSLDPVTIPLFAAERIAPSAPIQTFRISPSTVDPIRPPRTLLIRPHALAGDDERMETFQAAESETGSYDYGRWWHGWIEKFPWTGSELEQYGYTQNLGALPIFEERAGREVALFQRSADIRELVKGGLRFQSEIPFSFPETEGRWMEGVIDLVVTRAKGDLWIIDWKTNQLSTNESDTEFANRLKKKYLPQLEAYKQVIEQGIKRPVSRLLLYSTFLGCFL
jgi:ATP-dependent exoDNAse (exonuclease V) beta subunit